MEGSATAILANTALAAMRVTPPPVGHASVRPLGRTLTVSRDVERCLVTADFDVHWPRLHGGADVLGSTKWWRSEAFQISSSSLCQLTPCELRERVPTDAVNQGVCMPVHEPPQSAVTSEHERDAQ